MIKFFRKIRQNLLNEGKTSKYFKYAIGEIILVVIGILIALQINNWNESRIKQIKETSLLNALLEDVRADSTFYASRKTYLTDYIKLKNYLNLISEGNTSDSIVKNQLNVDNSIFEISIAYQSTVVTNNKDKIDEFSNEQIKELLRSYNLQHHYVILAYQQKDRYYEKYANDVLLKYFDKTSQLDSTSTLFEYYTLIEYPKHKKTINFINGTVDNSLLKTNLILEVNFKLQQKIKAVLNND